MDPLALKREPETEKVESGTPLLGPPGRKVKPESKQINPSCGNNESNSESKSRENLL